MSPHRQRTVVAGLVAAAVGVRVAASGAVWDTASRVASAPGHALSTALDGWSISGSLGLATAEGLRTIPLAAFYWGGEQVGFSTHVLQSGWRVLVLVLATVGAVGLARAALRSSYADPPSAPQESWAPWVAGLLYACGPVLVATTILAPLDGLALAVAPWVLAPLVSARSGWRAAAVSAAWLGLAGFARPLLASAVLVAGILAALPRRRQDLAQSARWCLLALLASAWWLAAAAWEAQHGRNVSALMPDRPWTEMLASAVGWPNLPVALAVLVAVGPVGVALAALALRAPGLDRRLVTGLVIAAAVVAGLVVGGLWSPPVHAPGAGWTPSPVLGPPLLWLSLGALVAWSPLVAHVSAQWGGTPDTPPADARSTVVALTVLALVLTANVAGVLTSGQERTGLSALEDGDLRAGLQSWSESAGPGRVLVLPTSDDVEDDHLFAASLHGRPWISRTSLPLSGPRATAALDEVVARLVRGDGGPGTAEALRRLGVAYVLLREEPGGSSGRDDRNAMTRAAMTELGGDRVGVIHGEDPADDSTVRDFVVRPTGARLEIWSAPAQASGWFYDRTPVAVNGDVGAIADLANGNVLGERPVSFSGATGPGGPVIVSDAARRRDVDQRVSQDPVGPVLGTEEPRTVVPKGAALRPTASRRVLGARSVTASSSTADLGPEQRDVGAHEMAAVDGNQFTAWESRRGTGVGEWWQIRFDQPVDLAGATASFVNDVFRGHTVTRVRLETDRTSIERVVVPGQELALELPGRTRRLRITVTEVSRPTRSGDNVGIAEVSVPGVTVRDSLVVSGRRASAWVLGTRPGSHRQCVPAAGGTGTPPAGVPTVCDRGISRPGFESGTLHRVLKVERALRVSGRAWVRAAQSETAARLADAIGEPTVLASASSVAASDLSTRPQAATDGDTTTAWRPSPEDTDPRLNLEWGDRTWVRGVELVPGDPETSSIPTRVRITVGTSPPVTARLDGEDTIRFPRTRGRSMTVTFLEDSGLTSVDGVTGGLRHVPVAISEVRLIGGPRVTYDSDTSQDLGCGSGPTVSVLGREIPTAVTASARDIVEGRVIQAPMCSDVTLGGGEADVTLPASFTWTPLGLALSDATSALGAVDDLEPPPGSRRPLRREVLTAPSNPHAVGLDDGAAARGTLVLATPSGSGWTARAGSQDLDATSVDGWAQAWLVPAGTARVVLDYSPGMILRPAAGLGALSWLIVLFLALSGRSARPVGPEPGV